MIELSTKRLLVRDGDMLRLFRIEDLQKELQAAARTVGLPDDWIPCEVATLVEERLLQARDSGETPWTVEAVRQLAARILSDAGYGDVAGAFLRRAGQDPREALVGPRSPWTPARVQEIIRRTVPVDGAESVRVGEAVCRVLKTAGLRLVSDNLVRELALHVGVGGSGGPERPNEVAAGPWLITEDEWTRILPPDFQNELADGVVGLRRVSRLLPRAVVRCDMWRLAQNVASGALTELAFYPPFARKIRLGRDLANWMERTIRNEFGGVTVGAPVLEIVGLSEVIEQGFLVRKPRGQRRLRDDMFGIVRSELDGADLVVRVPGNGVRDLVKFG